MRISVTLVCCFIMLHSFGQDNYEIQVYGSETVEKGKTMLEMHSNYTFQGTKNKIGDVLPTHHIFHETLEITHGFSSCFEVGFYIFTAIGTDNRTNYVGSHIRPRVSVPTSWHWPVGASFSAEFGFQKKEYASNTETLELRPIIDKKISKLYVAFNPVFGASFRGTDSKRGLIFSPNLKGSFDLSRKVAAGLEYYGSTGPFFNFDNYRQQQHQLFAAIDLNIDPRWEFNAGLGYGLTESTDRAIIKLIVGRKI